MGYIKDVYLSCPQSTHICHPGNPVQSAQERMRQEVTKLSKTVSRLEEQLEAVRAMKTTEDKGEFKMPYAVSVSCLLTRSYVTTVWLTSTGLVKLV